MSSPEIGDEARRSRRVELAATVLLALAAVLTAWSSYQSTQWRGEQVAQSGKGTAARIKSSEAFTRAGQLTQVDIATFVQWVDATSHGDAKLARFYRQRFRGEFKPAFAAWLASHPLTNPDDAPTPFALPQYRLAKTVASETLNAQAEAHSAAATQATQRQDNYVLAVVLFATALFFAGISTKLGSLRQREVLLGLGWLVMLGAVIWLVTLPLRVTI
jgi:hypothetical protein